MSIKDVTRSWDQEEGIIDRQVQAMRNEKDGFSCRFCKRLNKDNISCEAFPDVIPNDIKAGIIDHTIPFAGDNGLLFDPKDD